MLRQTLDGKVVGIGFNPHPARRPGATVEREFDTTEERFQPSPGTPAGCYLGTPLIRLSGREFQPSPGTPAGCYGGSMHLPPTRERFNPHPARRPGATLDSGGEYVLGLVSTLPRHAGRVLPVPL